MPLAIGFLATIAQSFLKNKVKTKIFIDPNKILKKFHSNVDVPLL